MKPKRLLITLGIAGLLTIGGLATASAGPVEANDTVCTVWIQEGTNAVGLPTRSPAIRCTSVQSGVKARARADCTAAPDVYTDWLTGPGTRIGKSCLFGASGAILELGQR